MEMNIPDITIARAQEMVDRWITTTGGGYFSELTNMAVLAEETGEVARIIARLHGDQRAKPGERLDTLGDELADVMWVVMALANQSGINLSEAFARNIEKKNKRDKNRFNHD